MDVFIADDIKKSPHQYIGLHCFNFKFGILSGSQLLLHILENLSQVLMV